jgi:hypothetical protein
MFKKKLIFSKLKFLKKKRFILVYILVAILLFWGIYIVLTAQITAQPVNQNMKNQVAIKTPKSISIQQKMKESISIKFSITKIIQQKMKELTKIQLPVSIKLINSIFEAVLFEYYVVQQVKDVFADYFSVIATPFIYIFPIGLTLVFFLIFRKATDDIFIAFLIAVNLAFIFSVFLNVISILWYIPLLALTLIYIVLRNIISWT